MPSKNPANRRRKSSKTSSAREDHELSRPQILQESQLRQKRLQEFLVTPAKLAMKRNVVTVTAKTTLRELEHLFETHDFNGFPVVEGHQLVGIVTKFDFLRNFIFTPNTVFPHYDDLMKRTVNEIMTGQTQTVHPTTPLPRVLQLIVETRQKLFPVVDEKNRLLGVISRGDLIRAMKA
jgi:CBS domain-containing protein